jgi:hypothetical protein
VNGTSFRQFKREEAKMSFNNIGSFFLARAAQPSARSNVSISSHIASIRNGHDLHVALSAGRVDLATGAFVTERRIEMRDRPPRETGKKD